jgi:signal transduction histidine kinase
LISDIEGKPIAVLQMCTDVTELKFLQSELAVLGETIAGMSHSVKNILAGLEGGVYVVDSGLKSGKDDKIRVGWEMVKKNVVKVSELVRDILYASKERQPEYVKCDPSTILNEIYELFSQKTQEFDISLAKNYPESLGEFSIDPKGIHTVLSNLMSNAIEACRSAGHAGDPLIELSAYLNNDQLVIRVTDNGIGMPEEVRKNLFTKFYSTKGSKGTGLGLVVSRKIIEEHGGVVEVSSEPGKGTQFCIKLPAANTRLFHESTAQQTPESG